MVAISGLQKALEDSEDAGVRWRAAEALGKLGSDKAIPCLRKALEDPDEDDYVRSSTAEALGKLGSEKAILVLRKALEDPDEDDYVRSSAAEALGKIGDAVSLSTLWRFHLRQSEFSWKEAIFAIQDRCKFYNYGIWQAAVASQNAAQENTESKAGQTSNIFPNATEVKIFERVEHYYEHPPDSKP